MTESIAVETITSLDRAATLEREWQMLLPKAGGATPFQSPAWLVPWYRVWASDRVEMMTARDGDGTLLAIVPAVRSNGHLELAGSGISDYLAPVVDVSAAEAAGAALDHVLAGSRCLFADVPGDLPWPDP